MRFTRRGGALGRCGCVRRRLWWRTAGPIEQVRTCGIRRVCGGRGVAPGDWGGPADGGDDARRVALVDRQRWRGGTVAAVRWTHGGRAGSVGRRGWCVTSMRGRQGWCSSGHLPGERATWTAGRARGRRGQGATCRPVVSRTLRHGWQGIVPCLLPVACCAGTRTSCARSASRISFAERWYHVAALVDVPSGRCWGGTRAHPPAWRRSWMCPRASGGVR